MWTSFTIDSNTIYDLRLPGGRIVARLTQNCLGGWELRDWRKGSLRERRINTYMDVEQAKREAFHLFSAAA